MILLVKLKRLHAYKAMHRHMVIVEYSIISYSLRSEIRVGDFVLLSTKFVLSHRHLFPIGGSRLFIARRC
jgi:hypothetical protein